MIKKVSLIIFLFFLAIGGAWSILWAAQEITETNIQSVNDINATYRVASGFSNTSKVQEQSPNGALGTTVTTTLKALTEEKLTSSLTEFGQDLNQASNNELININLTIEYNNTQKVTLKFFPTTPSDYEESKFVSIVNLINEMVAQDFATTNVTIYPTSSGRYVIANGGDINLSDISARQKVLLTTIQKNLPVGSGDVFDVTYENKTPTQQDSPSKKAIMETFYTSEWSYTNASTIDTKNIEAFRSGKNTFTNASVIKYIRGDQPNTDQMIIVIPETDDAGLQSLVQQMTKTETDKVSTPAPFTVYVRYALDGPDILTFRDIYAY